MSHSTSHAETLSGVGCSQVSILISSRVTELFAQQLNPRLTTPKALDLLHMQETNQNIVPVDHVTDCMDLFELVTNVKGLSSDKAQRLAILALREDRITRRIHSFVHVPTKAMLADGLTKDGVFDQLLAYATTGTWMLRLNADQFVRIRQRIAIDGGSYDEKDLIDLDW